MVILINHPVPTEGIHHQEDNVTAYFKDKSLGKGTLYIAENIFCWMNKETNEGFSLEYQSIFIHAVSKDTSSFPHHCLFLMVDGKINVREEASNDLSGALSNLMLNADEDEDSDDDDEHDPDYQPSTEMRFVPDNSAMLDVMFRALTDCQALNPDPKEGSDDDYEDGVMVAPNFPIIFNTDLDNGDAYLNPSFPIPFGSMGNGNGFQVPDFPIIMANVENGGGDADNFEGEEVQDENDSMNEEQFEDAEQ